MDVFLKKLNITIIQYQVHDTNNIFEVEITDGISIRCTSTAEAHLSTARLDFRLFNLILSLHKILRPFIFYICITSA